MKGIIFTEPMFHKVASGEKTQTRRIIKPQPDFISDNFHWAKKNNGDVILPRYKPGETLYLKEPYAFAALHGFEEIYDDYDIVYPCPSENVPIVYKYSSYKHIFVRKTIWQNKLFMPAKYARHFIEITGVRCERLQDISDEDCLKEGAVGWLLDWAGKKAAGYIQDYEHWVNDNFLGGHSQEISYCEKCGEKEVRKIKKEAKKAGATKEELDDIFLDGGWSQEDERAVFCAGCGKRLQFSMCGDLEEYLKERDYELNKYSAYVIAQYDEEDLEKIQGLPREAYAALIDSINGKGTWESNPFVFVYDFKLTAK
jgi:hypothetical protein